MIEGRKLFLGALGFSVVGLVTAAVFLFRPDLDLVISGYFADGSNGFLLRQHPVAKFFNDLINVMALVVALTCLLGWILGSRLRMRIAGLWARQYAFLLGALVLGPGIIANGIFKTFWGRARPRQTAEFGGTSEFSPPLVISDQCSSNCSFVSGDASMAFYFLAIALIAPKRYRPLSIAAALGFGFFIGLVRMVQGAHFFSDVVFAAVFTGLAILFLYRLMLESRSAPLSVVPTLSRQLGLARGTANKRPVGKSGTWMFFRATPDDLGVD